MSLELAGLFVTSGAVPPGVIDDALRRQVLAGGAFDTALLEAGATLGEAACLRFLERASGLPGIDGAGLLDSDPAAAALLPGKLAERHCLLPLRGEGKKLLVAVPFPISRSMMQEIGVLLGRELTATVALEVRLREAIARAYAVPLPPRYATLAAMLGPIAPPAASRAAPTPAFGTAALPPAPAPAPSAPPSAAPEPAAPPPTVAAPAPVAAPPPEPLPAPEPGLEQPEAARPTPELRLVDERDGLESALEKALEAAERDPRVLHRRAAPRDSVDVAGLAGRIVAAAGGTAPEPLEKLTLAKARAALEAAADRHAIMGVTLRYALRSFDFAAAFAVVGGNAVGWTALTREGFVPDRVERVSLPLDVPSVLRTVLLSRGRFLGPVPGDPISRQLVMGMGRSDPAVAFVCPIEVRERPVAILYADSAKRPVSGKKVAELVELTHLLGRRLERLILESKRKLTAAAAPPPAPAPEPAPKAPRISLAPKAPKGERKPPAEAAFLVEPTLTAAELFARSPARPRRVSPPGARGPALPNISPMRAPGVSRLGVDVLGSMPAMDELYAAADRLVGTDLAERARALGVLSRAPDVAAAVLASRFPGPLLRARVALSELPSPEELGPVPAALAKMGPAAARSLAPLIDHRDLDVRYFALLTAGRVPSPVVVGPVAGRVFDHHPLVANAARVALVALRNVPGFPEALGRLRQGLLSREPESVVNAAKALAPLHDLQAVERLVELTGHENKAVAQAAADALREITKQTMGVNTARWSAWWVQNRTQPRAAWLVDALKHRDLDIRLSAIDELVRAVNDNFGYYADAPKAQRDEAVARWAVWLESSGRSAPVG